MQRVLAIFLAMVLTVASTESAPPVPVQLTYESQCPGCQQFTTGTLKRVLDKPDMVAIMDLKLVAYGNTAYTSSCNSEGCLENWTCQHGEGECESDVMELCSQYLLANENIDEMYSTSIDAWPFILCMEEAEGDPAQGETCYQENMLNANVTDIPWSAITNCGATERIDMMQSGMKNTPDHQYVPWVEVNGDVLENNNALQKAICDAYTGEPPQSCRSLTSEPVEKIQLCENTN